MKQFIFIFMLLFVFTLSSSQTAFAQYPNMCTLEFDTIESFLEVILNQLNQLIQLHSDSIAQIDQMPQSQHTAQSILLRQMNVAGMRGLQQCESYLGELKQLILNISN